MKKIDLKKDRANLYRSPADQVIELDVPNMNFLMTDGIGDPKTSVEFQEGAQALYGLSYALKFMLKKSKVADYGVPPLEGLWWADDMNDFLAARRDRWRWTLMIPQPECVSEEHIAKAKEDLKRKGKEPAPVDRVRFQEFHEGRAAQILHVGPYATEKPTIEKLHRHIAERGGMLQGKHHEIYLGDPRRAAPQKLKTLLRQPFK